MWWPDATVGYFSGKHIVLWAVAAIILIAGIFYTAILFSWQWLLHYQHKTGFLSGLSKISNCACLLNLTMPPTPSNTDTGLIYCCLYVLLCISFPQQMYPVITDHTITLLATRIIVFNLTILVSSFRPYKSWPVQILEVICYANIVCFCFATLYVSKIGKNQDVITYISGITVLVLFLIV